MKYFLGFLASIGLIVVVVILVLHGFSGGSNKKPQTPLASYASGDMTVELTADGPINADQKHEGYHITVNNSQTQIQIYQGYQNNVVSSKAYANNQDAYTSFLHALDLAGFTRGSTDPKKPTENGQCATGSRYIYEVQGSEAPNERFWSGSCTGGTFQGKAATVRLLFQKQIPDFDTLTNKLELGS